MLRRIATAAFADGKFESNKKLLNKKDFYGY